MLTPDPATTPDPAVLERERCLDIIEERLVRFFAGPRVEVSLITCWEKIAGRPYDGVRHY